MSDSSTPEPAGPAEPLLERSNELALLGEWLRAVGETSQGRLVLVGGEAGVGKTTLLRHVRDEAAAGARVVWGTCDPLFTPQPLGPLLDIADQTGGEVAQLVAEGAKAYAVATALLHELARPAPTLLVIEDIHWADEASLDVLRVMARRLDGVPLLLLTSYRDDGLDRHHPLRVVLGELATAERVTRMVISPLSPSAVAELAAPRGINADDLYRTTGGNAFYVTEVLASADDGIPATVRDAVLARTSALTSQARRVLEAAAIVPPPVDLSLLDALVPDAARGLDECMTAGVLRTAPGGVAFRHELARLAVEESLPHATRRDLNQRTLAVLSDGRRAEVARLAHHADEAGDTDAVLRFAPMAAFESAAVGAHREAVAQLGRALRFAADAPPAIRGDLLDHRAFQSTLIGEFSDAVALGRQAMECWRELGDRAREARSLSVLSWPLWSMGVSGESERAARDAVSMLEDLPPGSELMAAYVQLSAILWSTAPFEAIKWGEKGRDLAQRLDERFHYVQALVSIATAKAWQRLPGGDEELAAGLDLARRERLDLIAGYAYSHLTSLALLMNHRSYAATESFTDEAIEYCTQYDLDSYTPFLFATRGLAQLAQGDWSAAARSAALVLARRGEGPATGSALTLLGLLRARRGEPGAWEALDEARRLADRSGELWRVGPVAAARAEAAWLEGRNEAVLEATEGAFAGAQSLGSGVVLGQLASWRRRAGTDDAAPGALEPYASQLAGDWRGASSLWRELGAPYAAALALVDGGDDDALRQALDELQAMGAAPAAAIVARRLRSHGVKGLPRGPRPRTRENPANLTARELEILGLVAEGQRNAEIAEHLFLSPKTVAHHVSSILRKLDVSSRGEATAAAARLGLSGHDG